MNFRSCLVFVLGALLLAAPALAQDPAPNPGNGTLHVVRPIIHAGQEKAELCLAFDQPLDPAAADKIANVLKLESGGKSVPVSPRGLAIDGTNLCLIALEHQKDYRLTLNALRAANGDKLGASYSLSFTVPPRPPELAFVVPGGNTGVMRWRDEDPSLRAINVVRAKLTLYRINDPARMAEAWTQRQQVLLAPSESMLFARAQGPPVWQSEMSFDDTPDKTIETKTPLTDQTAALPPGLYLLVAEAPEPKVKKEEKAGLAPIAALWLLRSDLALHALHGAGGLYALAEKADASAPVAGVQLTVMDGGQGTLVAGKSDENGFAFLPLSDNAGAVTLLGAGADGAVALADLTQGNEDNLTLPPVEASVTPDRAVYLPGAPAAVTLAAHDIHNQLVASHGSTLQLLRADRSLYASFPVSDNLQVNFPAPVNGVWPLVWRQPDGSVLAEGRLRVSDNPAAPQIAMSADRTLLGNDGELLLTLKSTTLGGRPAPWIAGRIKAGWNVPDHIFPGYEDYRFGVGTHDVAPPAPVASFITDDKGIARVHLHLTPPENIGALRAALISVSGDPVAGAAPPADLALPMKPRDFIIGVRPLMSGGRFIENSLARFDVVALDGDGKRRGAEDLTYQIYEEGRSFDWYQSNGRWEYKPLEQQRRIGGGALTLTADTPRHIEVPVTAGTYRLDILDGNGTLRVRFEFGAGWGPAKKEKPAPAPLDLTATAPVLMPGQEAKIHFTLDHPAIVTAVIADDQIRRVIHLPKSQGDDDIAFVPEAGWGNRIAVHIDARFAGSTADRAAGQLILPLGAASAPATAAPAPASAVSVAPDVISAPASIIFKSSEAHDIPPQNAWTPAPEKAHGHAAHLIFLAPAPLFNLPTILAAALNEPPFTSAEIAGRLEILRLWHDVIVGSGLLPEATLNAQRDAQLMRLLARQQTDGGFPAAPGGASDFASTAAALQALAHIDRPLIKPALGAAAEWLRHPLTNSWLEDQERPQRAAIYATLTEANQIDPASLHYFADTSAGKTLPPLAAAQLSLALARIGDKDKAVVWLSAAGTAAAADLPPEMLPLLTANPSYDPAQAVPALEKLSQQLGAHPRGLAVMNDFLRTLADLQSRAGPWRFALGKGKTDTRNGIAVVAVPDKTAPPPVHNLSDHPLYAVMTAVSDAPAPQGPLARHILRLDGSDAGEDLKRGETYVVTLEGPWSGDAASLVIDSGEGSGLVPVSCALRIQGNGDALAWLAQQPLTPPEACDKAGHALGVQIARGDNALPAWRIAYLAQADGNGPFILTAPVARDAEDRQTVLAGREMHVKVR